MNLFCLFRHTDRKSVAEKMIGQLPAGPLFWRIDNFSTLAQAQAVAGPTGLAAEVAGKVWSAAFFFQFRAISSVSVLAYDGCAWCELRRLLVATGTVKWFNPTKGYGFIQPQSGGKDVFVHISAVERAGLSTLNEGAVIEYEVVANKGKEFAENIKVK